VGCQRNKERNKKFLEANENENNKLGPLRYNGSSSKREV
jgi:hypothetical protein